MQLGGVRSDPGGVPDLTDEEKPNQDCDNENRQYAPKYGYDFEIKLDAPDGKSLGKGSLASPAKGSEFGMVHIPLQAAADGRYHTIYIFAKPKDPNEKSQAGIGFVQFAAK